MPRNPNKLRCQITGCSNWAMRGSKLCRSHRDFELGPRHGGASNGNLTAIKTGQYSHPVTTEQLISTAHYLIVKPAELPIILNRLSQDLLDRTSDPIVTLLLLSRVCYDLHDMLAGSILAIELNDYLQDFQAAHQSILRDRILEKVRYLSPTDRLRLLKWFVKKNSEKHVPVKN